MYKVSLELNRVYWKYKGNDSFMRPKIYEGVEATCPYYTNKGNNIREDMYFLSEKFYKEYRNDYKFVLALSGGIDSELVAETFKRLQIPFRAISLNIFNGRNKYDILHAYYYCKKNNIPHNIISLSLDNFINNTIPKGVELGQFCCSLSQVALTHLFDFVDDNEILIFSGHNPDYHNKKGWGWLEDSPNLVKYAINAKKRFFTFTSLEPIFLHYKANVDLRKRGHKDNSFIYKEYSNLIMRPKYTGWETCADIHYEYSSLLPKVFYKDTEEVVSVFITWKNK